jgi:hypothetical protein
MGRPEKKSKSGSPRSKKEFVPNRGLTYEVFFIFQLGMQAYELHPYTVILLKLDQILAILGDCQIEMMP